MARVKRGVSALKRRRNVLKQTKGYRFGLSKKERAAHEAIMHAGSHAFAHRRDKKNDFRKLWNIRINAAVRPLGMTYSTFIAALKKRDIKLDRKVLSVLAKDHPESFERLVKEVSK
ncbi:MAG TPA: 50S ribosomal protein L20 [Candidatus Paceibacterota bacterium]|jgi:large subunit ribosomal protein L20